MEAQATAVGAGKRGWKQLLAAHTLSKGTFGASKSTRFSLPADEPKKPKSARFSLTDKENETSGGKKKAVVVVADDDQEQEEEQAKKQAHDRWKRVSVWAKFGHTTKNQNATRNAGAAGDALKAVQTVRLWQEADGRENDCANFRFRAKLARRLVYARAREYIDDEHCIFEDSEKKSHSIKDIFHAVAVGARQVLLISKVVNALMALISEMQMRVRLKKITRDLCHTQDWKKFKENLWDLKKKMGDATDMHRDLVDFSEPREQMQIVERFVERLERIHTDARQLTASLKGCEVLLPKEGGYDPGDEKPENLWSKLRACKRGLLEAANIAFELRQAISLLGRGGHEEGAEEVESEASMMQDKSFLSSYSSHVTDKLVNILQEMGTDSTQAGDICKIELEELGARHDEVVDALAALRRIAWRNCVQATVDKLLGDSEAASSIAELECKIIEYEWAVPESVKEKNPVNISAKEAWMRLKQRFAKHKIVVPARYQKLTKRGRHTLEKKKRQYAQDFLEKTRKLLLDTTSARNSLNPSLNPSPDTSPRHSHFGSIMVPQGEQGSVATAVFNKLKRASFLGAADNKSDSENSDEEVEEDNVTEAHVPVRKSLQARVENVSASQDTGRHIGFSEHSPTHIGFSENTGTHIGFHRSTVRGTVTGRTRLEVPGNKESSALANGQSQVVAQLSFSTQEAEDGKMKHEGDSSSDENEDIKHRTRHQNAEEPGSDAEEPCEEAEDDNEAVDRGIYLEQGDVSGSQDEKRRSNLHVHFGDDVTGVEDNVSSKAYHLADLKERWVKADELEPADIEPLSTDQIENALVEFSQKLIDVFGGIEEAAVEFGTCGGDVGGSGMISLATVHTRLKANGYKRGLGEMCCLFRALGLTSCTQYSTISQWEFQRFLDLHSYYQEFQEDVEENEELHKLFSSLQLRRVLTETMSLDEYLLTAVGIALSTCTDFAPAMADESSMQTLMDAMSHCFELLHGPDGKRFAALVVSRWGLHILTDVIVCSNVSKEIRAAAVILISESFAQHGFPPCTSLNDDFSQVKPKTPAEPVKNTAIDQVLHLTEDFFMHELWRPLLSTIDPEGLGPPPPLDAELLEQMFLLLLQVHMPSWILRDHSTKLAAEFSLALRKLHMCPLEPKRLLRALRTFCIFEEDYESQHAASELHSLAAALGGCRLLREQLALLHAHEGTDGLKKQSASASFARQGDQMLRLWRAARKRLFGRWAGLRQKRVPLQKLQSLLQLNRAAITEGLGLEEPPRKASVAEVIKEKQHEESKADETLQTTDKAKLMEEMDPIFLAGSVEREAVMRLEQRWKMVQEQEQSNLYYYDWSRPSIPPLAQATKQSQAYLTRNGMMPLPLLPPRSAQGKRHKKKQDAGEQKSDGVGVMMLSSGPTLLCKTSRLPSRGSPRPLSRPGLSLQPLPESQVGRAVRTLQAAPILSPRRVQTASGGIRALELPWTVRDEPRDRSRPCTTGKFGFEDLLVPRSRPCTTGNFGIEDMSMSRAPWQVQDGSAWRPKTLEPLPPIEHFPEMGEAEEAKTSEIDLSPARVPYASFISEEAIATPTEHQESVTSAEHQELSETPTSAEHQASSEQTFLAGAGAHVLVSFLLKGS